MRLSAVAARRGAGLTAAAGLVAAGMQVGLAPTAGAAEASIERVGYTCTATNPIVDASLNGPQQFYVSATTTLPESVQSGDKVPATKTTLTLFLPVKLVNRLLGPMKVERVKGSSTSDVIIQGVAPGGEVVDELSPPVKNLKVDDWVTLTPDKEVAIEAHGNVDAIDVPDLPDGNGLIYVQMPPSFVLHSEMDPPVLGQIAKADLNCVRDENTRASRVIGTIAVGDGCEESDCTLPTSGGGVTNPGDGNGNGGGDGGGGNGDGEDPTVIDPNDDDATPRDNGDDDSTAGDDEDDDGSSGVAPYATTQLPATGSPVGAGLLALLGAAALGRVALAVRTRRRVKA